MVYFSLTDEINDGNENSGISRAIGQNPGRGGDENTVSSEIQNPNASNSLRDEDSSNTESAAGAPTVLPVQCIQLDDESNSIEGNKSPLDEEPLQQELLEVLGERLEEEMVYAPAISKDIAMRWIEIVRKGLPKNGIDPLLKKYPPPVNCKETLPPKLNLEVKASVPDSSKKRDDRIFEKQRKISACLGALGKSLSVVVKADFSGKVLLFEHLNNLGKLLTDLQHGESSVRKTLIQTNLNESFRDMLNATETDDWLFGKALEENIKSAKSLERSSKDLKAASKVSTPKTTKNGKGPQRQPQFRLPQTSNSQKPAFRPSNYQAGHNFKKNFPQKGQTTQKRRY